MLRGRSAAPSSAFTAGSGPLRSMMRARMLGAPAGTGSTIRYAHGTSADSLAAARGRPPRRRRPARPHAGPPSEPAPRPSPLPPPFSLAASITTLDYPHQGYVTARVLDRWLAVRGGAVYGG